MLTLEENKTGINASEYRNQLSTVQLGRIQSTESIPVNSLSDRLMKAKIC